MHCTKVQIVGICPFFCQTLILSLSLSPQENFTLFVSLLGGNLLLPCISYTTRNQFLIGYFLFVLLHVRLWTHCLALYIITFSACVLLYIVRIYNPSSFVVINCSISCKYGFIDIIVILVFLQEYKSITKMRLAHITGSHLNPSQFTVVVRAIPWSQEETYSDSVRKFFMRNYESSYLSHQMVYRSGKVQKLMVCM